MENYNGKRPSRLRQIEAHLLKNGELYLFLYFFAFFLIVWLYISIARSIYSPYLQLIPFFVISGIILTILRMLKRGIRAENHGALFSQILVLSISIPASIFLYSLIDQSSNMHDYIINLTAIFAPIHIFLSLMHFALEDFRKKNKTS